MEMDPSRSSSSWTNNVSIDSGYKNMVVGGSSFIYLGRYIAKGKFPYQSRYMSIYMYILNKCYYLSINKLINNTFIVCIVVFFLII